MAALDHDIETDTEEASRAAPDTARARVLAEELEVLDESKWKRLLPILSSIARRLVRDLEDVSDEDVLGELALRSHERWIREWCIGVRDRCASRSLWVFLHDRMRDHLREARRTQARRRALIGASGAHERPAALFLSTPITPEEDVAADELRDVASGNDPQVRAILALREAGFSQAEISKMLSVSRPTITRRLAAIAILMAGIATLIAIALAWPDDEPIAVEPVRTTLREPERPAAELPMEPMEERAPVQVEVPPVPQPPEPPARPEPLAQPTGSARLVVDSNPPSRVSIDGRDVGWTPVRTTVPEGRHFVVLTHQHYGTHRAIVDARAGETARVIRRFEDDAERGNTNTDDPFVIGPGDAEAEARRCTMAGDNACVIRALEGRARSEGSMAMLIEAYRSRGQTAAALRQMRLYVERFPGTPRARNYQELLSAH